MKNIWVISKMKHDLNRDNYIYMRMLDEYVFIGTVNEVKFVVSKENNKIILEETKAVKARLDDAEKNLNDAKAAEPNSNSDIEAFRLRNINKWETRTKKLREECARLVSSADNSETVGGIYWEYDALYNSMPFWDGNSRHLVEKLFEN